MVKKTIALDAKIITGIKTSKKTISKIRKLQDSTARKLKNLKDKTDFKNIFDEFKVKLAKTTTAKTREKYEKKIIELCGNVIQKFDDLKKVIEEQIQVTEGYKSELDLILEESSKEKRLIAQLKRNSNRGVFIYGETEIGEKLPSGSIFRSRYEQ